MRKSDVLLLERMLAACLALFFWMIVSPSIMGGATFFSSKAVVELKYAAIAVFPFLLVVLGQRRWWVLRIVGWFLLFALAYLVTRH